jgi:chromosome segregation ATPase
MKELGVRVEGIVTELARLADALQFVSSEVHSIHTEAKEKAQECEECAQKKDELERMHAALAISEGQLMHMREVVKSVLSGGGFDEQYFASM